MPSVRSQIFSTIEAKLAAVRDELDFKTLLVNPREPVGEDQMPALLLAQGGDAEPGALTGDVDTNVLDFAVGIIVIESGENSAEEHLDAGFVAVSDALVDPYDIQLGGLAVDIRRGAMSPPLIGRAPTGAQVIGAQEIEFSVQYWSREGDATSAAP